MGRRRLATLLAATLASGMIALPASALSIGEITGDGTASTTEAAIDVVEDTADEVLDAGEPVIEVVSTIVEEAGLDEVVPGDEGDDAGDLLAPVTDLFSEKEPAPRDEQDGPAKPTPSLPGSTRPADGVVTAAAPAPDAPSSSVRPAPLPGDGSSAPAPRTEDTPVAQVAPRAPVAAPRLDTAPATRSPELAVPVTQGASDAWLKAIASLMVLGTAGIWHRANRITT